MTQQIDLESSGKKKSLPLVGQDVMLDIDAELKKFEDAEREKLGLEIEKRWLEDMANLSSPSPRRPTSRCSSAA